MHSAIIGHDALWDPNGPAIGKVVPDPNGALPRSSPVCRICNIYIYIFL